MLAEMWVVMLPMTLAQIYGTLALASAIATTGFGVATFVCAAVLMNLPLVAIWRIAFRFTSIGSGGLRSLLEGWWLLAASWVGAALAGASARLVYLGSEERIGTIIASYLRGTGAADDAFGYLTASAFAWSSALYLTPAIAMLLPLTHLWIEKGRTHAL